MKISKKIIIVSSSVLLLIAAGSVFAWKKHDSKSTPDSETKSEQTTTESPTQPNVNVTKTTGEPEKSSENPANTTNSASALTNPSGGFVSNHKPSLSSPANQMNSVCKTSVGATCEIRFTKDGVTKVLGPNQVGSDGAVNWDWKLQDIGLSVGSWQVEAVATANGKTSTTKDPIVMEISQ